MYTPIDARGVRPPAPAPERFGPPRIQFGMPEIVTALCGTAVIFGAFLTWISGAGADRSGLDVPFMFLFRGSDAADSGWTIGLVVAALGVVGLLAPAKLQSSAVRALVALCGLAIVAAAIGTYVQLDIFGATAAGQSPFNAFGIGAWISGAGGLVMTATQVVSRFE